MCNHTSSLDKDIPGVIEHDDSEEFEFLTLELPLNIHYFGAGIIELIKAGQLASKDKE